LFVFISLEAVAVFPTAFAHAHGASQKPKRATLATDDPVFGVFGVAREAGVQRRHLVAKDGVRYFWVRVLQAGRRRAAGK